MKLSCYLYTLPFATPLKTSTQTFQDRKGFILSYQNGDRHFYGEVAPLPGFSKESHNDIKQILTRKKEKLNDILISDNPVSNLQESYTAHTTPAALQFGLDSLAYQIEAQKSDKSVFEYIFSKTSQKIPVNALVSLQDDPIQQIKQHITAGYKTLKCKIGLDFNRELDQLKKIRAHFPDITIRVDANQAWSLNNAIKNCTNLLELRIEYCEEPLSKNTPSQYEELAQNTDLPIAIDETIAQRSYWPNLLPYTEYLIIKPMLIGSFKKNIETKRLANTHNNKVVVTTSLESSVGRYFSGLMAAGIGSVQTAHGLSTGNLFSEDFFEYNSFISNGYFRLLKQALPQIDFTQQHIFTPLF